MQRFWGIHRHLRQIEIPQFVYLEKTKWTSENGFLTATEKKRRGILNKHYAGIVQQLYRGVQENERNDNRNALSAPFDELLKQILPHGLKCMLLGSLCYTNCVIVSPDSTLATLGCDSLATTRLVNILRNKGIHVTMYQLYPIRYYIERLHCMISRYEYPLSHISQMVETNSLVSLPVSTKQVQWELEWQLPADIAALRQREPQQQREQQHIFVTGCTGFFGPLLVGEILEQYPPHVRIYCLVREDSTEKALHKVKRGMEDAGIWCAIFLNVI